MKLLQMTFLWSILFYFYMRQEHWMFVGPMCDLCVCSVKVKHSQMSGVYGIRLNQTYTGMCVFRVLDFIFNEHMRPHI